MWWGKIKKFWKAGFAETRREAKEGLPPLKITRQPCHRVGGCGWEFPGS